MRAERPRAAANQILAQGWSPSKREKQRNEKRYGHGDRECAEKAAGDSSDGDEWKEDHDRSNGGADERNGEFFQRTVNRLETILTSVAMQYDVFQNDYGVVDNQADSGGQTAEGH